jgi:hypothetical protein
MLLLVLLFGGPWVWKLVWRRCYRDVSTHTSDGSAHVITVLLMIGIAGA